MFVCLTYPNIYTAKILPKKAFKATMEKYINLF